MTPQELPELRACGPGRLPGPSWEDAIQGGPAAGGPGGVRLFVFAKIARPAMCFVHRWDSFRLVRSVPENF